MAQMALSQEPSVGLGLEDLTGQRRPAHVYPR